MHWRRFVLWNYYWELLFLLLLIFCLHLWVPKTDRKFIRDLLNLVQNTQICPMLRLWLIVFWWALTPFKGNLLFAHFVWFVILTCHLCSVPFTVQRICELIVRPEKHYKSTRKLLFALEKVRFWVCWPDASAHKLSLCLRWSIFHQHRIFSSQKSITVLQCSCFRYGVTWSSLNAHQ